jgi:hypothetical protein
MAHVSLKDVHRNLSCLANMQNKDRCSQLANAEELSSGGNQPTSSVAHAARQSSNAYR